MFHLRDKYEHRAAWESAPAQVSAAHFVSIPAGEAHLDAFYVTLASERVSVRDVQPLVLGQRKVTWRGSGK